MSRSVAEAIRSATHLLSATSETPRLDAELLMAHALNLSRSETLLRAMADPAPDSFDALVARRADHEPVVYITGKAEFYGLELQVSPAVLIPRGDSETLIEAAREHFANRKPPQRILDLGTGSGALLLAALSIWPEAGGVGVDASMAALKVAYCNAAKLGMAERGGFLRRNWRREGWRRNLGSFDLILCNPPYVEEDAALDAQVRDHEPASALFAGPAGLDDYEILLPQIRHLLTDTGVAIFEIGATQQDAVSTIARNQGLACDFRKDLGGHPRAMIIQQGVGKATGSR
ncbi:MAG: protein-(glutamine-N5) methyltransferase, release factor-specific [Citromicrobium sp.]|nr:protein-(glutamine-N5) methyltransferase, release factor-specific [Citromicrobium sp.]